jgi:drug/metabolite transporter (DMT)-like permease
MRATQANKTNSVSVWAALIAVWIVWGSTYLAIRYAVQSIPPFLMAAARHLTAGLILYAVQRLRGDAPPTLRQWRSAAIIGVLMLTFGNGMVSWAEQRVYSGIAALLVGSVPIWIILLDWLVIRKQQADRSRRWMTASGIAVGFVGIVLLVGAGQFSRTGSGVDMVGAGALVLGSVMWAGGSLYSRDADLPESSLLGTGLEMISGGVGLVLLGTITGEWSRLNLAAVTPNSLLGLGYLITFGSLVGFAAYTWLLRAAPTALVSTYAYVNPIVALVMGSVVGAEPLAPREVAAAAIIVGAVALITLAQPARQKALPEGASIAD